MPLTLPDHSAFIRGALPGVSRTFALGISLLRDPLRDQAGLAYLLCRVLDTLEDAADVDVSARLGLLRVAGTVLDDVAVGELTELKERAVRQLGHDIAGLFAGHVDGRPDVALCRDAVVVMDALLQLPPDALRVTTASAAEMARGMAATMASAQVRLATEEELDRYCYYVAGTVGEMLTGLFVTARPEITASDRAWLGRHSIDFGLGLQMTNVIKDVTEDFSRGVVYLPQSVLRVSGADIETLLRDPHGQGARDVVGRITGRALGCLDAAYAYTLAVPASERDIRVFCALPLVLALRTLGRAVTELSSFEHGRAPKVSRAEVSELRESVESAAGDDAALGMLIRRERAAVTAALAAALGDTGAEWRWPRLGYVALGSNLGDRTVNANRAVELLAGVPGVRVLRESARSETAPVNCPDGSGAFLNSVIEVSSMLGPEALLDALLSVERQIGRIRSGTLNEPRLIDLDLVLVDGVARGWTGDVPADRTHAATVPHPRLHVRPFVLEPLLSLAPEVEHPAFGKPLVAFLGSAR